MATQPRCGPQPHQVVLGYTGHNNGIIRGVAKDPAAMEKFLIKIMDHYEKAKETSAESTNKQAKESK